MAIDRAGWFALALVAAGCVDGAGNAHAPQPVCPQLPASLSGQTGAASSIETPASLRVRVRPLPSASVVEVALELSPPAAAVELVIDAEPGALSGAKAHDARGEIPVAVERLGAGSALLLARGPEGTVHVEYRVAAAQASAAVSPLVEVDGDGFRATGRALLALPAVLDGKPTGVELVVEPSGDARAASSFGVGSRRTFTATAALLRDALFVAGPLGEARFDALEGHDEAAWTGYTAFDPRPIAADTAAFRTAARQALHEKGADAATLLIIADGRPRGRFVASRRASAVVVNLGPSEPWSGALRIAVAAEVLKRWVGGEVWIGSPERGREAEGAWFSEGVARSLARSMSFRFGVVTPAELLDEVHGLEALARTSPLRGLSNAVLAERQSKREPGAVPLAVARGALYAARVDALLRAKSLGKRGLEDVVRDLLAKSREARGPLPDSAWLDALRADLGAGEASAFAAAIGHGDVLPLPEGALGPCFSKSQRTYAAFEMGFDLEATRKAPGALVKGLVAGSAASRAGLTPEDTLVDATVIEGRADSPAVLKVERAGARRTVRYLPAGFSAQGEGWTRRHDVPDDACAR